MALYLAASADFRTPSGGCGTSSSARSGIFIATGAQTAISSVRSGIKGCSRLDVAPPELVPFFSWLKL
jgi:hypothetical protein